MSEPKKIKSKFIAVDCDGTIVTHEFPKMGRDIGATPVLYELARAGHNLILYTMRSGKELGDAVKWFEERKIPLFGVNENRTQKHWTESPKIYAHLYIDDAAAGAFLRKGLPGERPYIDWVALRTWLVENEFLPKPES